VFYDFLRFPHDQYIHFYKLRIGNCTQALNALVLTRCCVIYSLNDFSFHNVATVRPAMPTSITTRMFARKYFYVNAIYFTIDMHHASTPRGTVDVYRRLCTSREVTKSSAISETARVNDKIK